MQRLDLDGEPAARSGTRTACYIIRGFTLKICVLSPQSNALSDQFAYDGGSKPGPLNTNMPQHIIFGSKSHQTLLESAYLDVLLMNADWTSLGQAEYLETSL